MKESSTRYREVAEELEADIRGGKYATGRFPSLTQLMRKFGVSRPTAVRSVDLLKKKGVLVSRPGSGVFVRNVGRNIGLILPGIGYSEFFPPIISALSQLCQKDGFGLLFSEVFSQSASKRLEQARTLAQDLVDKRASGVIFQPLEYSPEAADANREIATILDQAKIPTVLLDYDICPLPQRSVFDVVGINNMDAGRRLAEHVIAQGARRICFFVNPHYSSTMQRRMDGVRLAAWNAQIAFDVLVADSHDIRAVSRCMRGRRRPDAFICGNDTMAAHLQAMLAKLSIQVARDVLLAGFDDVQLASLLVPPLTTIHQPCRDYAAAAYRTLMERMEAKVQSLPREIFVDAPLVVRESTQGIQKGKRR